MFLDSDDEGERYANIVAKGFRDNEEHKVQKKWIAKNFHIAQLVKAKVEDETLWRNDFFLFIFNVIIFNNERINGM